MSKNFNIHRSQGQIVDLKRKSATPPLTINKGDNQSEKILTDYYRQDPAKTQRFKAYANRKKSSFLNLLIILLFLLVAVTLAGFLVFSDKGPISKSLKLSLAVPKEVTAGENFQIAVAYENLDKVNLGGIELVVEYPENYYFQEATKNPDNPEKNVWHLNSLVPGQVETLQITGYVVGEINEKKEFKAIFNYRPENFSSDFQETIKKELTINNSLLNVSIVAPTVIEDGQEIELKVNYQNNAPLVLKELILTFDWGEAFTLNQASSTISNNQEQIDELPVDDGGELVIKGRIDSSLANPWQWHFNAWLADPTAAESKRFLFKKEGRVEIKAPQVTVKLSSGQVGKNVGWGDKIDYKIEIENQGDIPINQPFLKLTFLSGPIDWPSFDNQSKAKLETETNSLVWLSTNGGWAENLAEIKPQDKLELMLTIPLQSEPEDLVDLSPTEMVVEAVALLSFKSADQYKVINSEHLKNNIISELNLIAEAKYYLDQTTAVGTGPLPPQIGQTTSYRIYWKFFSGSTALTNIKIKTTLPAYITYQPNSADVTIGQPLKFDGTAKEVVWEIDSIAANSQVMASFNVSAIPDASQINQLLILTNPTTLEAKEQSTNQVVTKTNGLITSELINDPYATGQSRVILGE